MMKEKEKKTAVEELLEEDTPAGYCSTLSTFYEAYVQSPHCDGTNGDQRAKALCHFKSLRRFLFRINCERKRKKLKQKTVWIN